MVDFARNIAQSLRNETVRTMSTLRPLSQIDQQHLPLVHDPADPIEQRISQECADLVLNWRRAIGAVAE
jgi:hypothetical protein